MMMADTTNSQNGVGGADGLGAVDFVYCSARYATPPSNATNWMLASRHNDGFNCNYLDGHAKWNKTQQFLGLRAPGQEQWGH